MRILTLSILALAMAGAAVAQNSDLGLLAGVAHSSFAFENGRTTSEYRIGFQLNYAWQLLERPAGRLYLELPVIAPVGSFALVGRGVSASSSARIFVTPGIRYQVNLQPRLALYVAGGGGIAMKVQRSVFISGINVSATSRTVTRAAAGFGGGVDFRLTRLLSLRGEVRDLITSPQVGFGDWHNLSTQFGFALHF